MHHVIEQSLLAQQRSQRVVAHVLLHGMDQGNGGLGVPEARAEATEEEQHQVVHLRVGFARLLVAIVVASAGAGAKAIAAMAAIVNRRSEGAGVAEQETHATQDARIGLAHPHLGDAFLLALGFDVRAYKVLVHCAVGRHRRRRGGGREGGLQRRRRHVEAQHLTHDGTARQRERRGDRACFAALGVHGEDANARVDARGLERHGQRAVAALGLGNDDRVRATERLQRLLEHGVDHQRRLAQLLVDAHALRNIRAVLAGRRPHLDARHRHATRERDRDRVRLGAGRLPKGRRVLIE